MAEEAWLDKHYHDDADFVLHPKEKGARSRLQLARSYAAALAKKDRLECVELAGKLRRCEEGSRCGGGFCPQCVTATKRRFIERIHQRFDSTPTALLTIIPSDPAWQHIKLREFDFDAFKSELRGSLESVGLGSLPLIAVFDVCRNIFSGMVETKFWGPHWHCIIPNENLEEIGRRLRTIYRPTLVVSKPVQIDPITKTPERAYGYLYKDVFYERSQQIRGATSRDRPKFKKIDTHHPKFTALALLLDRIGLNGRVYEQ